MFNLFRCYSVKNSFFYTIFFSFISFSALAQVLDTPELDVSTDDRRFTLSWSEIAGADNFVLFYSRFPFSEGKNIREFDLGLRSSASTKLPYGSAFYVAIKAENSEGLSEFSNLKYFSITETPQLDVDVPALTKGDWFRPKPASTWQWQISGAINPDYDVSVYDIDLFDTPVSTIITLQESGKKVICYFSAGSYENFRADVGKFNPDDLGKLLDGWEDEQWLDIRSTTVAQIMEDRLDMAVEKGCDGVEPDNMTAYKNDTGINISAADQIAYNRFIANAAHARNLSVGLKNDMEQIDDLLEYYDFSVNEQCNEYDECETLLPFIEDGKAVFIAEYLEAYVNDANARNAMCEASNAAQFSTLILPLDLDDSLRFSCQE